VSANINGSIVFDGSIEWYGLSLNFEILQTKANFTLGQREDFHEHKSNVSFKILPTGQNFELVLLFTFGFMLSLPIGCMLSRCHITKSRNSHANLAHQRILL